MEGKYGEDQDGVGVEVKSLDLVVVQDRGEERREERNQTGEDSMEEERIGRQGTAAQHLRLQEEPCGVVLVVLGGHYFQDPVKRGTARNGGGTHVS